VGNLDVVGGITASRGIQSTGDLGVYGNIKIQGTLDNNGIIFPDGTTQVTAGVVPSGAVMFFKLSTCPFGWTEYTAAQGRYIVGLPSGGTLEGTAGTALTNLENRPAGKHSHRGAWYTNLGGGGVGDLTTGSIIGAKGASDGAVSNYADTNATITGVPGTNAPYIQLLTCIKN